MRRADPNRAQFSLDFERGRQGALDGIRRAVEHAESDAPGWSARADAFLVAYMRAHPGEPFICPQVRKFAGDRGLDAPPHERAWGDVFRRAARAHLIRRIEYRQYGDERTHTTPVSVWVAKVGGRDE